ncbi:MAG: tetratricopeptide repeat protein [Candidatus Muiribacteriaceae bacterium]
MEVDKVLSNSPLYKAAAYCEGRKERLLICIDTNGFNPESGKKEQYSYFFYDNGIIFQTDSILYGSESIQTEKDNVENALQFFYKAPLKNPEIKDVIRKIEILFARPLFKDREILFAIIMEKLYRPYKRESRADWLLEMADLFTHAQIIPYRYYFYARLEADYPENRDYCIKMYTDFLEHRRFDKALIYLERLLESEQTDNDILMDLAYIYKMQGELNKACQVYSMIDWSQDIPEHIRVDYQRLKKQF